MAPGAPPRLVFPFFCSKIFVFSLLVFLPFIPLTARADEGSHGFSFELGQEYSDYNKPAHGKPGRKVGKGSGRTSVWRRAALYLPNRFLDLIDVFKCDIGAGVGYGAVLRPSRPLQIGYRELNPGMLRLGLMGRRAPVLMEERTESGFGADYGPKQGRVVSPGWIS